MACEGNDLIGIASFDIGPELQTLLRMLGLSPTRIALTGLLVERCHVADSKGYGMFVNGAGSLVTDCVVNGLGELVIFPDCSAAGSARPDARRDCFRSGRLCRSGGEGGVCDRRECARSSAVSSRSVGFSPRSYAPDGGRPEERQVRAGGRATQPEDEIETGKK